MAFHYSPKVINDSLILYLDAGNSKSYSGSGDTWFDTSKSFKDSSLLGSPPFLSDNKGCFLMVGLNEYISIPQLSDNNIIDNYSFGIWFSPTITISPSNNDYYMLFEAQNTSISSTPDNFIYFLNSGGQITFETKTPNDNLLTTTNNWVAGKWYNIYCTYESSTGTKSIYVNGVKENSISGVNGSYLNTSTYFGLGAYSSPSRTWYLKGRIAGAFVYGKTLSQSEISQNYNTTKSRFGL